MSQTRTMFTIILPQAFRIIIPPLTNELVLLIKDTRFLHLGLHAGHERTTKFARDFMNAERNATPLTVVAILYLLITLPLTFRYGASNDRRQRPDDARNRCPQSAQGLR